MASPFTFESNGSNVQNFLDDFLGNNTEVAKPATEVSPSPQQAIETGKPEEQALPAEQKSKEEIEKALNDEEDKKVKEEEDVLVKDVSKFSETLKDKNILIPFEDGTLPSTQEELIESLSQSIPFQVEQKLEQAWREKVESLPESLLRIHEYAASGITSAQQIAHFTNILAQSEAIGSLDPNNAQHQEQIVTLQLMNTGLDEKSARDEVEDLKKRELLAERAGRFYPNLKRTYDDNVRREEINQQRLIEENESYVNSNATNVKYFLDKDTSYLPFAIDNRDRQYKADIYNLAGQVVDVEGDGSPVFGWRREIEALQFGDENGYKKFMKVMAFLANDKKYDEGVSKKVANTQNTQNFKKIATGEKITNSLSTETIPQKAGIPKVRNNSW